MATLARWPTPRARERLRSADVQAGHRSLLRENARLIWVLSLGAFGLAWSITTVAAYLPPLLEQFTSSAVLVGIVLAAEGVFAIILPLVVGPLSDATQDPVRPAAAVHGCSRSLPMTLALVMVAFMPSLAATAFVLFAFFFAYYIYEPPYRGLYPDLLPTGVFGRAQGAQHIMRGAALGAALGRRGRSCSPCGSRFRSCSPRA